MKFLKSPTTLLLGLNALLADGSPTPKKTRRGGDDSLIYITLEEHYDPPASDSLQTDPVVQLLYAPYEGSAALSEVAYINESRIESMNENQIRIQV
jgi:hypothetical protein